MHYRTLGRTGERVSAIGLGGAHSARPDDPEDSIKLIRQAIDGGITFLDNCWDYAGGEAEERMGRALQDGYRHRVFLMTKIDAHTREVAAEQIDQCLARLRTDRIDLLQLHEMIRPDDPERVFAPGGAMEALVAAREAGKIRYIGFTGHKDPAIHLRMLEQGFHFDAVQMPLNALDYHYRSFEGRVLPVLLERGIGVLGMKPLAAGRLPQLGAVSAEDCLRYAMSLPTSVVITGCTSPAEVDQALRVAAGFTPFTQAEMDAVRARAATLDGSRTGEVEGYKTSGAFDGTVSNPHWTTTASLTA
ncbi:MAG: aldo/keto reductase [Candidatus Dormibacteraeota bacterium]|nr:aldo/keto reductase [Candidatus Dormibacteraeota bacterium]